jgi:hypothetical protein
VLIIEKLDELNYVIKILRDVVCVINHFIDKKYDTITVKRIRKFYGIKSSDRSKIQFIWRSLEKLKDKGYIDIERHSSKIEYILPKSIIDIDKILE